MMSNLFIRLLNKTLEQGGLLKEANLFPSGDYSTFEVELLDGTYRVTILKKDEEEKDA